MSRINSLVLAVCLALLLFALAMLPGVQAAPLRQEPDIRYLQYNVELDLQPDGSFLVREIQQIRFGKSFRTAFAAIPLDYVTEIDQLQVWEGENRYEEHFSLSGPGEFLVEQDSGEAFVEWQYTPTEPGEVRTFTLEYRVRGGLWIYEDGDVLEWRAVPADRSGFSVESSRVTVTLPAPVTGDDLRHTAYGPAYETTTTAQEVIFATTEPIPDGTAFQVQVGFPHGLVEATVPLWQIREDSAALEYRMGAVDVELTLGAAGMVHVTERQRVAVDAGALYSGYRRVALLYVDDVTSPSVVEGNQSFGAYSEGCEYCLFFQHTPGQPWAYYDEQRRAPVRNEALAGSVLIRWDIPPLVKGESTTFQLDYDVEGAIQVQAEAQTLAWTVVTGFDAPVEHASARIHLPPGVSPREVRVEGGTMRVEPDSSLLVTHEGAVPPQGGWTIRLTLPPNATRAAKPLWQQNLEQAEAQAREAGAWRARQQVGTGLVGLFILLGGFLLTYLLWYRWGRDEPVELVAEYLSEPPSVLPPGIVAYLVDEAPSVKGALASIFHLATLGLLRIDFSDNRMLLQRNWSEPLQKEQPIETPNGGTLAIPTHLVMLFNDLLPLVPLDETVPLSNVTHEFRDKLPLIYHEMGKEATAYFSELPEQARHRWLSWGQWLVLGGLGATVCAWLATRELGIVAYAPPVAVMVVGATLAGVSRWMAQRTSRGVEEAARWLAFKRYLLNLKQYGSQEEAQQLLDQHFAYAVALDAEEVLLSQAETMGSAMPRWTRPRPLRMEPGRPILARDSSPSPQTQSSSAPVLRPAPSGSPAGQPTLPSGGSIGEAVRGLSLDGLSAQLSGAIQGASDGLTTLLNRAVGQASEETPFQSVARGTGSVASSTLEVLGDILEAAASGAGEGGYSGSSSSSSRSSSSRRSSWSSSSSRSSSSSSGRSSSSRRSGGGGSRGFG